MGRSRRRSGLPISHSVANLHVSSVVVVVVVVVGVVVAVAAYA